MNLLTLLLTVLASVEAQSRPYEYVHSSEDFKFTLFLYNSVYVVYKFEVTGKPTFQTPLGGAFLSGRSKFLPVSRLRISSRFPAGLKFIYDTIKALYPKYKPQEGDLGTLTFTANGIKSQFQGEELEFMLQLR